LLTKLFDLLQVLVKAFAIRHDDDGGMLYLMTEVINPTELTDEGWIGRSSSPAREGVVNGDEIRGLCSS
jgi:hypothetical protein